MNTTAASPPRTSGPGAEAIVIGASGGIGGALVAEIARSPAFSRVHAGCRRPQTLEPPTGPATVEPFGIDVADEASVAGAAGRLARAGARPSLVVYAVGVLHDDRLAPEKKLGEIDLARLTAGFTVNAFGAALVAKHFAALLPRRDRAVFAAISARVGSIGDNRLGGWYTYRASKAALNMLMRNVSIELPRRHRGTLTVCLHPGTVDTALSAPFQGGVPAGSLFSPDRAARQLLDVIERLGPDDNGGFFAWDGQPIPW
jgi:NAD(P)-dependent dehydrogenase (short-subunit alcohol dehydrogenase family)